MTQIADIIQKAMVVIDDVRLTQQLSQNPALFYRRMCGYVDLAVPMLNSPPELYTYITDEFTEPQFADTVWVSTEESTEQETVYDTGFAGYDLCSVSVYSADGKQISAYNEAQYDAETGTVTFPVQTEAGIIYDIDLYKDGSVKDLTPQMMRLFALAIAVMWNERLDNNWLNIQPKIQDTSFKTINESNYIDKMTLRAREKRHEFTDELKKFEQTAMYQKTVNNRPIF